MKRLCSVLLLCVLSLGLMLGGAVAEEAKTGEAATGEAAPATGKASLKIATTFAGGDAAAQSYFDLLEGWQEETGNEVQDFSAMSSEDWKREILDDTAAGIYDIVFFFTADASSAQILPNVVSLREILTEYPDVQLTVNPLVAESDGEVYAVPARPVWIELMCNTDLFEQYNLELPTTPELMAAAISTFKENGVIPISIALVDIPNYITEVSIMASGSPEDHLARPKTAEEIPESWYKGMELIRDLYSMGAFPENTEEMYEEDSWDMFAAKQAAMLVEGVWCANSLPEENWDTTVVIPFPVYSEEADPKAVVGGITMGFYLTKAAWEDPSKRDAAVSLLAYLTSTEASAQLAASFQGTLMQSAQEMMGDATALNTPISDHMDLDARAYWYENIIRIAKGEADPREVLAQTINMGAFTRSAEDAAEQAAEENTPTENEK